MGEGIAGDVGNVLVCQCVRRLLASPGGDGEAGLPKDAEVLGGERLGDAELRDQLMDAARPVRQLEHDRQSVRGAQRPQQLGGGRQCLGVHLAPGDGARSSCLRLFLTQAHVNILAFVH